MLRFVCTTLVLLAPLSLASLRTTAADSTLKTMELPEGFSASRVYRVPENQGSWVSLTVDPQGRLIASDQYGKLYRVTLDKQGKAAKVEDIKVKLGSAQGLLCAFDALYVVVNARKGPGLYRVTDTNGDDQYDKVEHLRTISGRNEHGPHAIVLGPDQKSLYIVGGNHTDLPKPENSLQPKVWKEDHILPRMWDARGHARGKLAPGGWICRTDKNGKTFTLFSSGYRNAYDIAFNRDGELFTFDSDMEWDIGTPWYRPTRVLHATSGSEFGWRSGTGKWPTYYPDSLPPVAKVGPGSPTGVTFGYGAKFPHKYQNAFFACDWSYGNIFAVHLEPEGSSYTGKIELFATAAPLPVTDIVINPQDGAMYFAVGGRRVNSAVYRIVYKGEPQTEVANVINATAKELRKDRRFLEEFHGRRDDKAVASAWPFLKHEDRFIRYAARIAIENQPVGTWQDRALAEEEPRALIRAMIALARHGKPDVQSDMLDSLGRVSWPQLDETERLALLRAYQLIFSRLGEPTAEERKTVLARIDEHYPADSPWLNRELSRLLVYLEAPEVVERTLTLLRKAKTQEQQIHFALVLRNMKSGWTLSQRKEYFRWFRKAAGTRGGASFGGFLRNIKNEAVATLAPAEKKKLGELLDDPPQVDPYEELKKRDFVKNWTVEELVKAVEERGLSGRSFQRGRSVFSTALCFSCHRFNGDGGISGPDLTAVGKRFSTPDLLASIIEPSKAISSQYGSVRVITTDGRVIAGRIANLKGDTILIMTDMLNPGNFTGVKRDQIEEIIPSKISMMPKGLLNNFSQEEILDLIAYLKSAGDPQAEFFTRRGE